jgi:hypothetical protein
MRHEVTDHEWAAIKPMLPNKARDVPRVNDRTVLSGKRRPKSLEPARRPAPLAHVGVLMKNETPKLALGDRRRNPGLRLRFCDTETGPQAAHAPRARAFLR